VHRLLVAEEDATIVGSIVDLAHGLGLTVVAEGIDSIETETELRTLGCDCGSGLLHQPAASGPTRRPLAGRAPRGLRRHVSVPTWRKPRQGRRAANPRMRGMPSLTRDEVAHLARLARLDLADDELDHLSGQLDAIVGAVARVAEGGGRRTSHRYRKSMKCNS
jgi:hypothetical protein